MGNDPGHPGVRNPQRTKADPAERAGEEKGSPRMMEDTLTMRGSPVRPLPRPSRTWSRGRVCAAEECPTQLSIYNKSPFCWVHEPVKFHLARGKRRSKKERQAAA